jgi:hypothetical protein
MVTVTAEKQSVVRTFMDMNGGSHDIANINSMSRNSQKSSVSMEIDGQTVIVEVTPTEAINIMELLN